MDSNKRSASLIYPNLQVYNKGTRIAGSVGLGSAPDSSKKETIWSRPNVHAQWSGLQLEKKFILKLYEFELN